MAELPLKLTRDQLSAFLKDDWKAIKQFENLFTQGDISVTHVADSTIHFTEGSINHNNIQNIGSNTHTQIDTHIGDGTIHFTEASINHTNIQNIGSNTHAQIDTHIGDGTIHFTEGSINHLNIQNIGTNSHSTIDSHIGDGTIHFTEGSINHLNIQNIGTNSHSAIDSHIGDGTIHFTEGSIDHTNIQNIGTNSHSTIDSHIGDGTIHFTVGSIDHTLIQNIGSNTHSQIDSHITSNGASHTFLDQSVVIGSSPAFATQAPADNSTKAATTAYVDAAVLVENLWDRTGTTLKPSTSTDQVEWDEFKYQDATTGGSDCLLIGPSVGTNITAGATNLIGIGNGSLAAATTADNSIAIGENALASVLTAEGNIAIGINAGYTNATGDNCVFLGHEAGYYETASNKLFIDNVSRTDEADGRIKSLIYGEFAATTASQTLTINGYANIREAITGLERSSDPAQPAEGEYVIWLSDGTGKGDDGDVMIASQAGGTTNYGTLFDHSAGSAW